MFYNKRATANTMQILLGIGHGLTLTKSLKIQFNLTSREVSNAQQKSAFQRYRQGLQKQKMKTILNILAVLILFSLSTGCNNDNITRNYYIVSLRDSMNTGRIVPPIAPLLQPYKWYLNIVFIMDSTDMVYVYQTETKELEIKPKFIAPFENENSEKEECEINYDTLIYEFNYPNYLGLKPQHLIAIDSKNFISFIKLNNDIFQLETDSSDKTTIFYIASNMDTIKNDAFYDLIRFVTKYDSQGHNLYIDGNLRYLVRKTTEEENVVIKFKRNKKEYHPEQINWTSNFIDGKSKPFTKEYDLTERKTEILRKAKETYKIGSFKFDPIY
jgi:hypothetical protein